MSSISTPADTGELWGMVNALLWHFHRWTGKRRKFALGANLKIARKKLDRLKGENAIEKNFDAEKNKAEEGMTVVKWGDCYLKLEEIKTKRSFSRECDLVGTLKRLLWFDTVD